MRSTFRVGITRDFLGPGGKIGFGDIGLDLLDAEPAIAWEFLPEAVQELLPRHVRGYDALLVLGARVTERTLAQNDRLVLVARFGVGYDTVDVDACTRRGVLLTITPDGVRRPVAAAALTLVLALSHKLLIKDRLTRGGRWGEKHEHMGTGLSGRTLGVVGFGNIGREVARLARTFDLRVIACDPYVEASAPGAAVELVGLDDLLAAADHVVICCALTPETRHLIDERRLALMKPTAYLINVARGGIVDQRALTRALRERRIQGAGLDVFETEPIDPDDPLLALDNVILAPHGLCWTDECFRDIGKSACRSILDVADGRTPAHAVNPEALAQPLLAARLRELAASKKGPR